MLEISPAQLGAFEASQLAGFRNKLFAMLVTEYPDFAHDRQAVAAIVDAGMADARDAGFTSARGIATYVTAAFLFGMDIKDQPVFDRAIRESGYNEASKIDWLSAWMIALAEEAAR